MGRNDGRTKALKKWKTRPQGKKTKRFRSKAAK
jgi:hypothetical protein